jgi:DHA1 family tetracycline resistance protein-like MFS transporter
MEIVNDLRPLVLPGMGCARLLRCRKFGLAIVFAHGNGIQTGSVPGIRNLMKKASIGIIFLTVMIDLVGFGLILPLIPIYSDNFTNSGFMIGLIISAYSIMQFIFAPIWGRLSDRIGRRPVLLGSTACACLSYVIFAIGSGLSGKLALGVMLLSRAFAGICGANITVAQAYIADITPPEERSAKMGLIGMAFGLGFILGPILGAISSKYFGLTAPGWTAASLCALNFLWAFARLAESWKPSAHYTTQRPHIEQWLHILRTPRLNLLMAIFFLATFCFTCFESTIGLLIMKNFDIDPKKSLTKVSLLIAYCGVIGAAVQGGGTRRMVKKMGEPKLIALSLFLASVGIAFLPYLTHWGTLLVGLAIFSIGSSLTRPPVFGMISMLAPAHEQGVTMGVAQGVGSLARIVGPVFAASLFMRVAPLPYLICGALCLLTSIVTVQFLTRAELPAVEVPPVVHPGDAPGGEAASLSASSEIDKR